MGTIAIMLFAAIAISAIITSGKALMAVWLKKKPELVKNKKIDDAKRSTESEPAESEIKTESEASESMPDPPRGTTKRPT